MLLSITPAAADENASPAKFDPAARAKIIARFLDDQPVVLAHVDLTRIDASEIVAKGTELLQLPEGEFVKERIAAAAGLGGVVGALAKAGASEMYGVVSATDFAPRLNPDAWTFVVVPLKAGADEKTIAKFLSREGVGPFETCQRVDDCLVAASRDALARLRALKPAAHEGLAEAFEAAGDTVAQAILVPSADNRRVIDEMLPTLPAQIGGGPSTAITRGLGWAAVGIELAPKASLRAVVQSRDAAAAQALRGVIVATFKTAERQDDVKKVLPDFPKLAALITPDVKNDRLVLTLGEDDGKLRALTTLLRPVIGSARAEARRASSINNLKQIAMAMHMYHGANNRFPAAATYNAQGKPLLSWRVQILPFLGEEKLYKEFRLDEPWDSDHNKALIPRMPKVYAAFGELGSPEPNKTCYLVPVGEGTIFAGREGRAIKDIQDGTSDTILLVEADEKHAVIWTCPDDLKYDPKEPLAGLVGLRPAGFVAAFADGSVRFLAASTDKESLRRMFTANDGKPAAK
ncbi:MAG: DUF1559 family PulG-like putative transporter [Pirellulales bacterium]